MEVYSMATFLKLETGWKDLETGEFFEFGQISINIYNYYHSAQQEYYENYDRLIDAHDDEGIRKLDDAYEEYLTDDVSFFISIIESYVNNINFNEKGFTAVKSFNTHNNKYISQEKQKETHEKLLEIIRDQGWNDVPEDTKVHPIDIFLMQSIEMFPPFSVVPHFINGKWYMVYDVANTNQILILDLIEMRNCEYKFHFCKNCDSIHIQKDKKNKYCPECSRNYKKVADKNRPESPRYSHKKVQNYLQNSEKFTSEERAAFNEESDFYWYRITGKQEKSIPDNYRTDIITVDNYISWCEEKHEEFKKIAKTRKKINS